MSPRLAGKVAIVTGAASGYGKGIAQKFLEEGAKVVIADLSEASGQNTAKELGCSAFCINITQQGDWESLLKHTVDIFGTLDIIVNNAGTTYENKPTERVTPAEFDLVFNVNVRSIFLSTSVLVPWFLEQGKSASFINIASTAAIRPRPNLTWYNASKAAVSNATKTMAVEYAARGLRFNTVCPGVGQTGLTSLFVGGNTDDMKPFLATVPMGRPCMPSDVASACCYLASDEASFITGVELEVDGGRCV